MEFIAVDGVLPDTSVKLGTKDEDISLQLHLYNRVCIMHYKIRQKNGLAKTKEHREVDLNLLLTPNVLVFTCCLCHWE